MAATVQSVERAVGVLRLLEQAPDAVGLGEIAGGLGLAKPTVHGLVRTLVAAGLVDQDRASGRYRLRAGVALGGAQRPDPHVLRSHAMNWTDRLAARTGLEVRLGVLGAADGEPQVELAHHVYAPAPDDAGLLGQRLRTGEHEPLHATALGLVLLALVPGAPAPGRLDLRAWTSATPTDTAVLADVVAQVRRDGWAAETGSHRPGEGAVAVPVLGASGSALAAVAVAGRQERVLDSRGRPAAGVLEHLRDAAHAVGSALEGRAG